MEYDLHTYRDGGDARCPQLIPASTYRQNVKNYLTILRQLPELGASLAKNQYDMMGRKILDLVGHEVFTTERANEVANWYSERVGTYGVLEHASSNTKLEYPLYQGVLIWGSQFENNSAYASHKVTLWRMTEGFEKSDTRPHESMSEDIHNSLWGTDKTGKNRETIKFNENIIKDATFEIYSINAYNTWTRDYEYNSDIINIKSLIKFKLTEPLKSSGQEQVLQ